jgi:ammonium transporter Rh
MGEGAPVVQKRQADAFFIAALVAQAGLAILHGCFSAYGPDVHPSGVSDVNKYMNFYVDVTTMIFIGFGFLMTFMQKHSYGSIVFTFFISVFVVQWALLAIGFGEKVHSVGWDSRILLSVHTLIDAMFCAGSVMISFGAVIGKVFLSCLVYLGKNLISTCP